ncbi:RIP metalloprotease RseP [Parachitinimonas caeni]|uniref:Zinc metalloprotease n=1 Tax=Parachitinimonas caeni TaxID=3031301 RepID=A0ABT7DX32_9NEIS|nr:RIP metalloprotease RseP [Parachitinimonas caeni]MDK2124622.1 RIP metalloprotease RseP [Parachitinimonas caeni]
MSVLLSITAFIITIGILVTFHELGHYWVARKCGVKVLTFSFGFGPCLWSMQRGDTTWQIAAIPLGGYVRMLDEREGPVAPSERQYAFDHQSLGKRAAVIIAGPAANFLLAIAVLWGIYSYGVEELRPVIGAVVPGTPAALAGLQAGDEVKALNASPIASWQSLRMALLDSASAKAVALLEVRTAGGAYLTRELDLRKLTAADVDEHLLSRLGLSAYRYLPVVYALVPNSAAAQAGVLAGDKIISVDGRSVSDWNLFSSEIRSRPGQTIQLGLVRGTQQLSMSIAIAATEEGGTKMGRLGILPSPDFKQIENLRINVQYGPIEALQAALTETWDKAGFSLKMLWRMVAGNVSWKQISGPVSIADYAGQSAKAGFQPYLEFLCLLSISIGVLNLLPIPVLDGGHLLYYAAEFIKGSPLSIRTIEIGQRVGLLLLFSLMAFALINDMQRFG